MQAAIHRQREVADASLTNAMTEMEKMFAGIRENALRDLHRSS